MGATSAQGFGPGILRGEVEDSSEDVNVGNSNKDDVQASEEQSSCQPIPDIDGISEQDRRAMPMCSQNVCAMILTRQ